MYAGGRCILTAEPEAQLPIKHKARGNTPRALMRDQEGHSILEVEVAVQIYSEEEKRSQVVDIVAPILEGLEKHLSLFKEPEVFVLPDGPVRIRLTPNSGSVDIQVVEHIGRVAKENDAQAWIYSTQANISGGFHIAIEKDFGAP